MDNCNYDRLCTVNVTLKTVYWSHFDQPFSLCTKNIYIYFKNNYHLTTTLANWATDFGCNVSKPVATLLYNHVECYVLIKCISCFYTKQRRQDMDSSYTVQT